jgi:hypothetical protein
MSYLEKKKFLAREIFSGKFELIFERFLLNLFAKLATSTEIHRYFSLFPLVNVREYLQIF